MTTIKKLTIFTIYVGDFVEFYVSDSIYDGEVDEEEAIPYYQPDRLLDFIDSYLDDGEESELYLWMAYHGLTMDNVSGYRFRVGDHVFLQVIN